MVRRKAYTELEKQGQERPPRVKGLGDVLFKGFQCLAPTCGQFIFVRASEMGADFRIPCPACDSELVAGGETKFFDYRLRNTDTDAVIEAGDFVILHDDYVAEAHGFKHCVLCYALKPVELFDKHGSRASGYQSECRLCKTIYNGIKNQSRTTDQHREAAQRRRLYLQLADQTGRIDSKAIFEKFDGKCFNCGIQLVYTSRDQKSFHLDHTLPARLLWPMTTENATLLCSGCNNQKHDQWPSNFYGIPKLKQLAVRTGYEYALLAGPPQINEAAVTDIVADVDSFLEAWIPYPDDIKKVRRLIREHHGVDIFYNARNVPTHLRDPDETKE